MGWSWIFIPRVCITFSAHSLCICNSSDPCICRTSSVPCEFVAMLCCFFLGMMNAPVSMQSLHLAHKGGVLQLQAMSLIYHEQWQWMRIVHRWPFVTLHPLYTKTPKNTSGKTALSAWQRIHIYPALPGALVLSCNVTLDSMLYSNVEMIVAKKEKLHPVMCVCGMGLHAHGTLHSFQINSLFWHVPMHYDEPCMTVLAAARAYCLQ